jgi:hypothetical protein
LLANINLLISLLLLLLAIQHRNSAVVLFLDWCVPALIVEIKQH